MFGLYPIIEPYEHGMLDVGEGCQVYRERCGNPSGKAALVLHGGPGSGCSPGSRRPFDPSVYRIVLFDQRGSGRSMPHASESNIDLSTNPTAHLLADIELLNCCDDASISSGGWCLEGPWGSTLALAYAQRHPHRVTEMVLVKCSKWPQSTI
jgi:proline iminopeptidase